MASHFLSLSLLLHQKGSSRPLKQRQRTNHSSHLVHKNTCTYGIPILLLAHQLLLWIHDCWPALAEQDIWDNFIKRKWYLSWPLSLVLYIHEHRQHFPLTSDDYLFALSGVCNIDVQFLELQIPHKKPDALLLLFFPWGNEFCICNMCSRSFSKLSSFIYFKLYILFIGNYFNIYLVWVSLMVMFYW